MPRKDIRGYGTSFDSKQWLSLDVAGCMGISVSWFVHMYAMSVLGFHVVVVNHITQFLYVVLYIPSAVLAMVSLFQASTTDPGAVPLGARPFVRVTKSGAPIRNSKNRRSSVRRCHKCGDNYKPDRAHHDSVTDRCIVKFDHFCPWVNNAVGALNHKFFCLFLFYTAISCVVSILILVLKMIRCGYIHHSSDSDNDRNLDLNMVADAASYLYPGCKEFFHNRLVLGLGIVSFLFLIFTCAMGCEQLEAISSGKGKIARMKQSVGQAGTEFNVVTTEFNEMFGGNTNDVSWHWFLPIPVRFPRGMKQVVLGYEFNETCLPEPFREPGDVEEGIGNNIVQSPLVVPSPSSSSQSAPNSSNGINLEGLIPVMKRRPNSRDASEDEEGITLMERSSHSRLT